MSTRGSRSPGAQQSEGLDLTFATECQVRSRPSLRGYRTRRQPIQLTGRQVPRSLDDSGHSRTVRAVLHVKGKARFSPWSGLTGWPTRRDRRSGTGAGVPVTVAGVTYVAFISNSCPQYRQTNAAALTSSAQRGQTFASALGATLVASVRTNA